MTFDLKKFVKSQCSFKNHNFLLYIKQNKAERLRKHLTFQNSSSDFTKNKYYPQKKILTLILKFVKSHQHQQCSFLKIIIFSLYKTK